MSLIIQSPVFSSYSQNDTIIETKLHYFWIAGENASIGRRVNNWLRISLQVPVILTCGQVCNKYNQLFYIIFL